MSNDDLRAALLRTFLDDIRPRLERLGGQVAAGDAAAVEFEAHGLKGMCGAIGAARCASLFKALESAGRAGDLAQAPALVRVVHDEVTRVEHVLTPLLDAA